MQKYKETLINISEEDFTSSQLVCLLELLVDRLDIDTPSEMGRKLNKTPSGLKRSKSYSKIKIGKQLFIINN